METAYRISKLCHEFRRGMEIAFFHALTYNTIFGGNDLMTLVNKFKYGTTILFVINSYEEQERTSIQEVINTLVSDGFLIPTNTNEIDAIVNLRKKLIGFPEISILYLLLTGKCNMNCSYCFVESEHVKKDYQASMMDKETAKLGIDIYAQAMKRNKENKLITRNVYFYGGEPLLNWNTLAYSARYILDLRERGDLPEQLLINLVTNGTLVTKRIAKSLKEFGVFVSVSIDGPEKITNINRKFLKNNKDAYSQILRGIELLQEAGIDVGISCTIKDNVDSLAEIIHWFSKELGVKSLGFNVLMGKKEEIGVDNEYFQAAAIEMLSAFRVARELGIYEDRIMRKVKAFVDQKVYPKDCGGCGRQIVITADCKVGPCHAYAASTQKFFKKIHRNYDPLNDQDIKLWSHRSPLAMPFCYDCPAVAICGGGCAYHADENYGSIWAVDDRFCYQAKLTLEWLIWDLKDQMSE